MQSNFQSLAKEQTDKIEEIKSELELEISWKINPSIYELNAIHDIIKQNDSKIKA